MKCHTPQLLFLSIMVIGFAPFPCPRWRDVADPTLFGSRWFVVRHEKRARGCFRGESAVEQEGVSSIFNTPNGGNVSKWKPDACSFLEKKNSWQEDFGQVKSSCSRCNMRRSGKKYARIWLFTPKMLILGSCRLSTRMVVA